MDASVISDIPLTLRAPIGGAEGITTCALGDRAFLVSSGPDVLHLMVVASEDVVEIVQTFDALPEKNILTAKGGRQSPTDPAVGAGSSRGMQQQQKTALYTVTDTSLAGVGHRASKMLFAASESLVFILIGGCLRCFGYDSGRSSCFPAAIIVDEDVIDFDMAFCPQLGLVVAALFAGNITQTWTVRGGTFLNLSEGELPTAESGTQYTRIQFVASPVVCAYDDTVMARTGYTIVSVDTLTLIGHIDVAPTPNARLMVTPLYDAMERATLLDDDDDDMYGDDDDDEASFGGGRVAGGAAAAASPTQSSRGGPFGLSSLLSNNKSTASSSPSGKGGAKGGGQASRPRSNTRYNFTTPSYNDSSMAFFSERGGGGGRDGEWEAGNGGASSRHSNKFAVLAFNPRQVLEFRLEVYQLDPAEGMRHVLMVPLVCVAHPTLISSVGPWLVVGLPYGIEYYDWPNGEFAQSALDSRAVVSSSVAARIPDFNRASAAHLYTTPMSDIVFYVDRDVGSGKRLRGGGGFGAAAGGAAGEAAITGAGELELSGGGGPSPSEGSFASGGPLSALGALNAVISAATSVVNTNGSPLGIGGGSGPSSSRAVNENGIGGVSANIASVIGGGTIKLSLVVTAPVVDVVFSLMAKGVVFQGLQPTDLMEYGHDIGAEAIVGGADYAARLSSVVEAATTGEGLKKNSMFNEYGAMLTKFVHLHREAGTSNCDGCKYCAVCGNKFGLFRSGRRCALCNSPCCDDCAPKYDLRDYGFMNVDPTAPIFPCCSGCIPYADQTLYLLMASKRYLQLLQYASDYPHRTADGFPFDALLGLSLNQCFLDGRFDMCARIVIRYITQTEQLQEWIARFASARRLHVLANVFDPRRHDPTLVTTIMMATMKSDPSGLRALVRKWPAYCYDVGVVALGIEQQLRKRRADCAALQAECETTPQSEDDRRAAVGLLYIDTDTTQLLLALLHIYSADEEHASVVRAYIEHFDQFQMTKEERAQRRPRAGAVMVPNEEEEEEADLRGDAAAAIVERELLAAAGEAVAGLSNGSFYGSPTTTAAGLTSDAPSSAAFGGGAFGRARAKTFASPTSPASPLLHNPLLRSRNGRYWGSERCQANFVTAASGRRSALLIPYNLQPLDVCEYIKERDLYPIALAPYGHNNNFTVMTTMLRLHADEVSEFLATMDRRTCESLLDVVLQHLLNHRREQLYLLHALTQRSLQLTAQHHDRLADLYIDLQPQTFLWFVKQKQVSGVDWRRVLQRVQQRRMYAEMVYVVGRIGNDKDAIRIALRNLKSVYFAMQYVNDGAADEDREPLWRELLGHVIQSSTLIGDCMEHIAEFRDPAEFLAMIPTRNRVVIPNIGARLGAICREQRINKAIEESSLDVFRYDNFETFKKSINAKRRAIRVSGDATVVGSYRRCGICRSHIALSSSANDMAIGTKGSNGNGGAEGGVVFAVCGHAFHEACLTARFDISRGEEAQRRMRDEAAAAALAVAGLGDSGAMLSAIDALASPTAPMFRSSGRQRGAAVISSASSLLFGSAASRADADAAAATRGRSFTMSPAAAVGEDGTADETREEREIRKAARLRAARRANATYSVLRQHEDCRDIFQLLPNHLVRWILSYCPPRDRIVFRGVAEHWRETIDVAKAQLAADATVVNDAPLDPFATNLVLKSRYLLTAPRAVPAFRNTVSAPMVQLSADFFVSNSAGVHFSPMSPLEPSSNGPSSAAVCGGASCVLCESVLK